MPLYEHVFLARQDISSQQVDQLVETFKGVVAELGGTVGKVEYWGVKPLSFRINKNRKAHYTLMNIDAPHAAIAEMERQMGISEDVLRFMTIRVEELEEGPSAMMQKRDRDDRGDRGDRGDRRGGGFGGRRDRDDRGERRGGGGGGFGGGRRDRDQRTETEEEDGE
ncbi:MAG TPA: 30S ribosomal protein S6 [Hyphomicrobiales bacterium]|nr:30S ribosomal protein S6 [Kaistiaceae bacterium]HQF31387.1 30S ribosomal protein S6 [Hyphomicrobiales bacterium]